MKGGEGGGRGGRGKGRKGGGRGGREEGEGKKSERTTLYIIVFVNVALQQTTYTSLCKTF